MGNSQGSTGRSKSGRASKYKTWAAHREKINGMGAFAATPSQHDGRRKAEEETKSRQPSHGESHRDVLSLILSLPDDTINLNLDGCYFLEMLPESLPDTIEVREPDAYSTKLS